MLFHIIKTEGGEFSLSPTTLEDKLPAGTERLTPGLPLVLAQSLIQALPLRLPKNGKTAILKLLRHCPGLENREYHWESIQAADERPLPSEETTVNSESLSFTARVRGRQLSEVDLQRLANERGLSLREIVRLCQGSVCRGQAEWIPALRKERHGWRCMRCGETEIKEWPSLYGLAGTCPSCSSLGALSSLQALYRTLDTRSMSEEPGLKSPSVSFSPHWPLSQAQERASRDVLRFVSAETGKNLLLWAACGAGKTEVCFPAADWALRRGFKILFAAPRQDVVLDVAPRLERDFPGLNLSVLTGVSTERFVPASLVLATTHQVLRFYQTFDLIFLDEVDAFPYYGNAALAWGLQQALKPGGKMVYLTATPSPENQAKVQNGEMELVRLPARHHRRPLPVPEWIQDEPLPSELYQWVSDLSEGGPVLLFVPKISRVDETVAKLRRLFPDWSIEGSYSSDPGRREKIEKLKKGGYPVFVSTSILERGITVPNAQVIVLEADHEIFDERALVQMVGRVGRTSENPHGKALLLAQRKTSAIQKAIEWIKEQNRIAGEQGLID